MSTISVTTYRGVNITYSEEMDRWYGESEDANISRQSLAKLKQAIDQNLKTPSKYKGLTVLNYKYGGRFEIATITTITIKPGGEDDSVWIRNENGKKEKVYNIKNLYVKNPENVEKMKEIMRLRDRIGELNNQINTTLAGMERFEIEEDDNG